MNKEEYIEQLIEAEESKRNKGWQGRVQTLRDMIKCDRQLDQIDQDKFRGTWIAQYEDVLTRVNKHKQSKTKANPKPKAKAKWSLSNMFGFK